ncbi:MAG TPA: polysaccharide deacetylase family protein [Gaiellaceae bacterium]|nr:polysaccharide deacetylase family protein [Gaiellaceae bacterium]
MGDAVSVPGGVHPGGGDGSQLLRRIRRNGIGFFVGWLGIVVLLVGLGTQIHLDLRGLAVGAAAPTAREQAPPAARVTVPPALVARLRALPAPGPDEPPLLLTYHGIAPTPRSPFAIAPRRLQAELTLLHDAGYHSIGAALFVAWLHGRATLPRKAVLLTFDDGLAATWRYADPILAALGFRAVNFLITGHIDRGSFYLTSEEIRRMAADGRWNFGAHTAHGHTHVSTGPGRPQEAFLVGRRWLPRRGRPETDAEFAHRIRADTRQSLRWFAVHKLPQPRLFAYPFSAATSADRRATRISVGILSRTYAARFLDDSRGGMTTAAQRHRGAFRRLDVLGTYSLGRFVSEVMAATPIPPSVTQPLAADLWTRDSGAGTIVVRRSGITLEPRDGRWLSAALAPTRTLAWSSYDISARASLAGTAAAGIAVPGDGGAPVSVAVSRGWFEVRTGAGRTVVAQGQLHARVEHWLRVSRSAGGVTIAVDAATVAVVPAGRALGGPSLFVDGTPGTRVQFTQIRVR